MSYSARRGFSNQRPTGAQRQAELQKQVMQMQSSMDAAREEVERQEFTASAGGGAVEAKVNGKKELLSLRIKPEVVDPEDVEMLEDLTLSAVNEALRQAGTAMQQKMDALGSGLNLGGLNLGNLGNF